MLKSKVKSMFTIFFDMKWIIHIVLAGQRSNCAYFCNVLRRLRETVRRLRLELWQEKNWLSHHDNEFSHTYFFTRDSFYQKQHYCLSPPTLIYSVSLLKFKLRGSHFVTTKVVEAESQTVLKTLIEYYFQVAFKKL
jgi:hypothetical protein